MPIEILMPALSPTMTQGNLARWLKKEGDKVKPGDVLAEIETDKATMEVESIDEGILGKILIASGSANVAVNSLIALLLEEGENPETIANYTPKIAKPLETNIVTNKVEIVTANSPIENIGDRIKISPLAKRLANEKKLDLRKIIGTGPYGRIIRDDILNIKEINSISANRPVERNLNEYKIIENSNIRKIIAQRLLESKQTVPHFYLSVECNIDKLLALRADLNSEQEAFKLSINDFIIKAVAMTLAQVPEANGSWTEDAILQYNNIDIAVAVALENGLITPIIKNADCKSIIEISNEMKSLAKRARETGLRPEEFQGGGFSISNLGMYKIKNFKAIINPPQSCIMAVGASNKRAIVINEQIKIATMMDISLSCDHRVIDGAVAAKFLSYFQKMIENPIKMIV